jgi:hypothetical protein
VLVPWAGEILRGRGVTRAVSIFQFVCEALTERGIGVDERYQCNSNVRCRFRGKPICDVATQPACHLCDKSAGRPPMSPTSFRIGRNLTGTARPQFDPDTAKAVRDWCGGRGRGSLTRCQFEAAALELGRCRWLVGCPVSSRIRRCSSPNGRAF